MWKARDPESRVRLGRTMFRQNKSMPAKQDAVVADAATTAFNALCLLARLLKPALPVLQQLAFAIYALAVDGVAREMPQSEPSWITRLLSIVSPK